MRDITRPFLPRGILTDQFTEFIEPVTFKAAEICGGYWRVKRWLLRGSVTLATQPAQYKWQWDFTIPIVANNMRRKFVLSDDGASGSVQIVEEIPQDELALTPTVGTIQDNLTYDSECTLDFTDSEGNHALTFEFSSGASAEIYSTVWRKWQKGKGFPGASFLATAQIIVLGPDGLAGPTPYIFIGYGTGIGDTPMPVDWTCQTFTKNITATGSVLVPMEGGLDEFFPADITDSSFSLEVEEYWQYAASDGNGAKFDPASGADSEASDDGDGDEEGDDENSD